MNANIMPNVERAAYVPFHDAASHIREGSVTSESSSAFYNK